MQAGVHDGAPTTMMMMLHDDDDDADPDDEDHAHDDDDDNDDHEDDEDDHDENHDEDDDDDDDDDDDRQIGEQLRQAMHCTKRSMKSSRNLKEIKCSNKITIFQCAGQCIVRQVTAVDVQLSFVRLFLHYHCCREIATITIQLRFVHMLSNHLHGGQDPEW